MHRPTQVQRDGHSQTLQRPGLVLVLRSAFLGDDRKSGLKMPKPNRRTRLVAFLPTRAAGAVGVDDAILQ